MRHISYFRNYIVQDLPDEYDPLRRDRLNMLYHMIDDNTDYFHRTHHLDCPLTRVPGWFRSITEGPGNEWPGNFPDSDDDEGEGEVDDSDSDDDGNDNDDDQGGPGDDGNATTTAAMMALVHLHRLNQTALAYVIRNMLVQAREIFHLTVKVKSLCRKLRG